MVQPTFTFHRYLWGTPQKNGRLGHTAKPPNPPSGMEASGNGVSLMVGLFREVGQKVDINFILEFEWKIYLYTKEEDDDDDHWPPRQFKVFYFKQSVNILTCYIGATMIALEFSYRCCLPIWHRVATFHFSFL